MDITHWQEHAPTVEQAAECLEAEDRAKGERYDRLVKARMDSLEAAFEEEGRDQPEPHKKETYLKAKDIGTRLTQGITGKAYPRGKNKYWFEPNTGAMGVRVGMEDPRFLESGQRNRD
jgi:hypothetical protein